MQAEFLLPIAERIAAKTRVMEEGCHLWMGHCLPEGYGTITHNGKRTYVHRVVWELANGPIPEGFVTDHLCRNTSCVNLEHIEMVTQKVNALRGDGPTARHARKTHCIRGHPFDDKNTIIVKTKYGTGRQCRICVNARNRARYAKRKAK